MWNFKYRPSTPTLKKVNMCHRCQWNILYFIALQMNFMACKWTLLPHAHLTGTSTLSPSLFALPRLGGCVTFSAIIFCFKILWSEASEYYPIIRLASELTGLFSALVFVGGQRLWQARQGETRGWLRRSFGKKSEKVHLQKTPDENAQKDQKMWEKNL